MGFHLGWHSTLRRYRTVTSSREKKMKKKLPNATTLDNVKCTEVLRRPDETEKILKWCGQWFSFLLLMLPPGFLTKQVRIAVYKKTFHAL
jgi:hypothetical protein